MSVGEELPVVGALLTTRFTSYEQLKGVIQIAYSDRNIGILNSNKRTVYVRHCSGGRQVVSSLTSGVSEKDIAAARDGGIWERLSLLLRSPYTVLHRRDLESVLILARRRQDLYGDNDPAFYDISERMVANIHKDDTVHLIPKDLISEKGYLNTINHIIAQAFTTSLFSERLADFVADAHERKNIPELITGAFSADQISDLDEGPVDNYIDLINNEWGQELGKVLGDQYQISEMTIWTPDLMTNYLNDLQSYFTWACQIRFTPFRPDDEIVEKFAYKINGVMQRG
jgi:hypothetical protein